jgi:hypothetical protein
LFSTSYVHIIYICIYINALLSLFSLSLSLNLLIIKALLNWLPGAQQSVISANRTALEDWLISSRLQARKIGATLRGRFELVTSEAPTHQRTAVLRQVEVYLGFGVWMKGGSVEPIVRHALKHVAMPEMPSPTSSSESSTATTSSATTTPSSGTYCQRHDDLTSEGAARVMEELVASLGTLDHASHVHATRSPK